MVAATGLVAAAGLSIPALPMSAARAATPGKIYACYSDKTNALFYLNYPTVKTCPTGQTMISWKVQGPQGKTGAQGAQGKTGAQGPQGKTGAQGAAGPQGPQGKPGAQGAAGPQGPQGKPGSQGSQGAQGSQGPAGATAGFANFGSRTDIVSGTSTVASATVSKAGQYVINATAVGFEYGGNATSCFVIRASNGSPVVTTTGYFDPTGGSTNYTVAEAGFASAKAGAVFKEECHVSGETSIDSAAVDGVLVDHLSFDRSRTLHRRDLANRFAKPRSGAGATTGRAGR